MVLSEPTASSIATSDQQHGGGCGFRVCPMVFFLLQRENLRVIRDACGYRALCFAHFRQVRGNAITTQMVVKNK